MSSLIKLIKSVYGFSISLTSVIFMFVPEKCFLWGFIEVNWTAEKIIMSNRLLCFLGITMLCSLVNLLYRIFRKSVTIKGVDCKIVVEYADVFDKTDCKKIIAFDECYTSHVGENPEDIKPNSVCGQFLQKYSHENFNEIVQASGVIPQRKHSRFRNKNCYKSGSLIRYEDYLLLSFAKLDEDGRGFMTREDFLSCLDYLWTEIDKKSRLKPVAMPILGSGITRFKGESLSQQQLLDI